MNRLFGKKRFWLLAAAVIVIIIISFIYIMSVGNSYAYASRSYLGEYTRYDVTPSFSQEGIVEYTGAHLEDGEIILSLRSLTKGETDAVFTVNIDGNIRELKTHFVINSLGTIFQDDEFIFNFSGYKVVILQIIIVLLMVLGVAVYTFIELARKAKFSYRMIAAGGVSLYSAILIAFLCYKLMNNVVTSFSVFIFLIGETGLQFLFVMSPFMFTVAFALSVSNIWLLRKEGYRPVNALGIAFSIVWLAGMLISFNFMFSKALNISDYRLADGLNKAFVYICCYFECMMISTICCAYAASRHTPPHDRDCIIILGCAIRADGTPTPLLRMRADSAAAFEEAQYRESGNHAVFVPSGGQGGDEIISEAESMRRYLNEQGIPDERILKEDKSNCTDENMRFSKAVIEKRFGNIGKMKIAFATTNYHVFRGYILARKNGFEAEGISAKTKWYFFPNAFLREFVGLLADKFIWHIAQVVCLSALFIWLSFVL